MGEVDLHRHGQRPDRCQVSLVNGLGQGVFIRQTVKHPAQILLVAPVGRCRHAQYVGIWKMFQNALIAVGNGMVCLVDDNGLKVVRRKLGKAFLPHEGLNAAHRDTIPLSQTGLLCLFHGTFQTAGAFQLVRRLLQQLAPMCQYQHPIAAANFIFGDFCKDNGLAAPGGQHQQRPLSALVPLPVHGFSRRLLIRSHLHDDRTPFHTGSPVGELSP